MSNYDNENDAIPMEGAVHYERDESTIVPEGTYHFRILRMKREQVNASDKMPRHVNVRFMLLLSDKEGKEAGRTWDNLRMYRKWLWKYSQLAKGIGHTPKDSSDIYIDWSRFEGSTGTLKATVGEFTKRDGTVCQDNKFEYLPKEDQVSDEDARFAMGVPAQNTQEEMDF